jgi:cytochrome c peroxidase
MRCLLCILCLLCLLAALCSCDSRPAGPTGHARKGAAEEKLVFVPLPPRESLGLDLRKVALGRALFDDKRLSGDGTVACSSCHLRERSLSNGLPSAELATRVRGTVNVPTLYNVVYNYRFNWDGRYLTLDSQLDELIQKPNVMRSSWPQVVERLAADPACVARFSEVFPGKITGASVRASLIEYMSSLTTPGARFDRWLAGDEKALSDLERRGYRLFNSYGCSSCHQGRNIGGNMLQEFGIIQEGIIQDYFRSRGKDVAPSDRGHGNYTGRSEDNFYFRVPSLRNVALTAPYFHDGGAATLDEAVQVMGKVQLGRDFDAEEVSLLVGFLLTLTGELDDEALR